jgi:hypothetical protein
MELFEFINVIFTNPSQYSSITPGEKRKHYFMCQRRFAIQFPMQANALQHLKINQSAVIDFWQTFLRRQYNYLPKWNYVKGAKKAKEVKEKKLTVSNDLIKEYCRTYKVDSKTIRDALEFYPEQMIKELHEFEKIIKQK